VRGLLALVGGAEWTEGASHDEELLEASGQDQVLVVPTAAAYEHPDRAVTTATAWFEGLGARVEALDVLQRRDALDEERAARARRASFIYLGGGSPLHLRSVLKDSPVLDAIRAAWDDGAVLAGSSAGAMALCDPMIDPRGGAFTVGLGLVVGLAVLPHAGRDAADGHRRTLELAEPTTAVAAIPERTALLRSGEGRWRAAGATPDDVTVFVAGQPRDLGVLP
jgi:cyanophycinase